MLSVHGVVFDLDGTLVSSHHDYGEMTRRVKQVLIDSGVGSSVVEERGVAWQVMRGGPDSLKGLGIQESQLDTVAGKVTAALNSVEVLSLRTVEAIPNAKEVLDHLKKDGYSIGIATRACKEYSEKALEKLGLKQYIDAMLARDEVVFPKPDPKHLFEVVELLSLVPEDILFIGDTSTDLNTARAANVHFVAYLGNPRWAERMKEAGIEYGISDLIELKKLVMRK